MNSKWAKQRKRLYEIIEVGYDLDYLSRGYDIINVLAIIINLSASILFTFTEISEKYGNILSVLESITVAFFALDFILRILTAKILFPNKSELGSIFKYMTSFSGVIDILSFAPYYLPVVFPGGAVAFRVIRIVRIFRLFKINAYYN